VENGSQQQWLTRNSSLGQWNGGVWNMVFVGVQNAPSEASYPNPPYTTVGTTPIIREKPYLYVDGAGNYNVFVPSLRSNTSNASWPGTPGTSIPLSNFHIVRTDNFSVASINTALSQGQHVLFTPGVYHVNGTINVTQPNTVVMGMGLATLIPDNGVVAMRVADVDGVKIAHLLFDAGTTSSPVMLEVGPAGSAAGHGGNPTSLHDVFCRIGGAHAGKAAVSLTINSHDVILDHAWLWRGDHGTGVGWTVNTADTGLIVNGNNVTAYGLFVEHYQKYEVIWNGNNGRTYFFQNEKPYDVPSQAAWMNGSQKGYAAYKVADAVTTHQAWGVGSYCLFLVDPANIAVYHSFEVPVKPGISFHHLVTISLGGTGTIERVINDTGGPSNASTPNAYVIHFP
jgi:hypothetical protein